jgi:HEAT repeat protein
MLGEAAGVNRHQVHRANRRQKAKERQEVAATLEATRSEKTALARTAVGHLARCAERARNGALELENPGEVAVAFLEKLQDPDWKTRWQACRGLVALGYSPSQIQGWLQGTMTLPAPRLGQKGT